MGHDDTCGLDLGIGDAAPTCPACIDELERAFRRLAEGKRLEAIAKELAIPLADLRERATKPVCVVRHALGVTRNESHP